MDKQVKIVSRLPSRERLVLIALTTAMGGVFIIVGLYALTSAVGGLSYRAFGGVLGAIFTGVVLIIGGLAIITTCVIRLERKSIAEEAAERILSRDEYAKFVKITKVCMNIRILLGTLVIVANVTNCILNKSIWVMDASSLIVAGVLITWVGETQRFLQILNRVYPHRAKRHY
jgi:hypothetical protein